LFSARLSTSAKGKPLAPSLCKELAPFGRQRKPPPPPPPPWLAKQNKPLIEALLLKLSPTRFGKERKLSRVGCSSLPFEVLISCSISSGYFVSLCVTSRLHSGMPRCLQAAFCLLHVCVLHCLRFGVWGAREGLLVVAQSGCLLECPRGSPPETKRASGPDGTGKGLRRLQNPGYARFFYGVRAAAILAAATFK